MKLQTDDLAVAEPVVDAPAGVRRMTRSDAIAAERVTHGWVITISRTRGVIDQVEIAWCDRSGMRPAIPSCPVCALYRLFPL
jgi:hypothetical protein